MNKSKSAENMRTISRVLGIGCAGLTSVLAFACGGYDGSGAREVFSNNAEKDANIDKFDGHSRYSIKVYVPDEDGKYELVELSPQNAAYAKQQAEEQKSQAAESTTSSTGDGDGTEGTRSASGDGDSEVRQKGQRLEIDEERSMGILAANLQFISWRPGPTMHAASNGQNPTCRQVKISFGPLEQAAPSTVISTGQTGSARSGTRARRQATRLGLGMSDLCRNGGREPVCEDHTMLTMYSDPVIQ